MRSWRVGRQKRMTIEELYGPRLPNQKTSRIDRDYDNMIMNVHGAYGNHTTRMNYPKADVGANTGSAMTSRRKSARMPIYVDKCASFPKDKKTLEASLGMTNKKDQSGKIKTARLSAETGNPTNEGGKGIGVAYCDVGAKGDQPHIQTHHHHHHHQRAAAQETAKQQQQEHSRSSTQRKGDDVTEDEKDDDNNADEFFTLVREAVDSAVAQALKDKILRQFREMSSKIISLTAEMKATNEKMAKLQAEVTNKVVHYGEENSRHFRYLCMKSEYDKMFYQHHTMMVSSSSIPNGITVQQGIPMAMPPGMQGMSMPAGMQMPPMPPGMSMTQGMPLPPAMPPMSPAPALVDVAETPKPSTKTEKTPKASTHRQRAKPKQAPHKTSSESQVSGKSSDLAMRDMISQIQHFCNQQLQDMKSDENSNTGAMYPIHLKMNKPVFHGDDDDDSMSMSSDGITPRSPHQMPKYGGLNMRLPIDNNTSAGSCDDDGGDDNAGNA